MKIGHCQYECTPGDFAANLAAVVRGVERAADEKVEIVTFPECFLTGYQDKAHAARKHSFAVDSAKMKTVLAKTKRFRGVLIVGFNEKRGDALYNTALVARAGKIMGFYSKCTAYMPFHKQGREFPVFDHKGLRFGVVICSDGGYIEPSRILALKGAKVIFAPHYNYITKECLINHFQRVRIDHAARAVENRVYFLRANNVNLGPDKGISYEGVGYGDSYIIDPDGQIVVHSRLHQEDFIAAEIDPDFAKGQSSSFGRSAWSLREFGSQLMEAYNTFAAEHA